MLGENSLSVAYITNWILNIPPPAWMPTTYFSDTHKTKVDLRNYDAFLVSNEVTETCTCKRFFYYTDEIQAMVTETGRLLDITRYDMQTFFTYVAEIWFKVAPNCQLAEIWGKNGNECTAISKDIRCLTSMQ